MVMSLLTWLNPAPIRPPRQPIRTKPGISHAVYFHGLLPSSPPNANSPDRESIPHELLSPFIPERKTLVTKPDVIALKRVLHVRSGCHQDVPSSRQNMTPAKGAPNAAATPAAAPHAIKSLFSLSFRNSINFDQRVSNPNVEDFPWESPAPMIAPVWIIGPSLPTGKPEPTAITMPPALAKSVFIRMLRLTMTPFRRLLISGIPEPAATGSMRTKRPPNASIPVHRPAVIMKAAPGMMSPRFCLSIQCCARLSL
mmetsp:Transcript_30692/g.74787  ORF Transcript_30692/g.74787 Transcript_30692/m.74787 type:complete len:254 (+) Transcript_30692:1672-2433(+)